MTELAQLIQTAGYGEVQETVNRRHLLHQMILAFASICILPVKTFYTKSACKRYPLQAVVYL